MWKRRFKHGHTRNRVVSRTYKSWCKMKERCRDINGRWAPFYREKGICVCEQWLGNNGFMQFLSDMGERPEGTTMERIDNDLGYFPGNCRWGSWEVQSNNRSVSVKIENEGKTQSIEQWARELNVCSKTMHYFLRVRKIIVTQWRDKIKTGRHSTYLDRRSLK